MNTSFEVPQKTHLLLIHVVQSKNKNKCELTLSHTAPLSEFEKVEPWQRFSKNKCISVTFRQECPLIGFHHKTCFRENFKLHSSD